MKVSCNIIRDLLPLYAEDLVSQDSRQMVDEHLCECDACVKELAALKKAAKVPAEIETGALKRLEDTIRRKRILTAAAAVMTLLTLAVTGVIFLMTPYCLTAEEAVEGVELREDGGLAIDWASGINGHAGWSYQEENQYAHLCHTTRYDWFRGKQKDKLVEGMTREELEAYIMELYELKEMTQEAWDRFYNIRVEYGTWETSDGRYIPYDPDTCLAGEGTWVWKPSEENHWYADIHDGSGETLIWGADDTVPEKRFVEASYAYSILFFGALALAVLAAVLAWRRKGTAREVLARLAILGGGVAFATLLVTSGDIIIVDMMADYKWPGYIVTESVFVVLTALLWYQLSAGKQ